MGWNDTDKLCEHCGNVTYKAKGFNKQNLKRLFTRFSLNDFIILFIILLVLFLSWAYQRDTAECRYFINNINQVCMDMIKPAEQQQTNQTTFFIPTNATEFEFNNP